MKSLETLELQLEKIIPVVLKKQMKCKNEPKILLYDTLCPLSKILSNAYKKSMPDAEHINVLAQSVSVMEEKRDKPYLEPLPEKKDEIREKLKNLPAGATVVMVQSTNFRLDDFRIRLQLFNQGVGCLEHTRLEYYPESDFENYVNAFEFRGDYYKSLGGFLKTQLETSDEIQVYSKNGDMLSFGQMEEAQLNHGMFAEQKNRGGAAISGEIFSEAKDFSTVNGKISMCCYPNLDFEIVNCEPFTLTVENSYVTCSENTPEYFKKNIYDMIANGETDGGRVMMREAGFGLNPALSFDKPLSTDVSAFERQAGFHISIGKKHNIYRKKFPKKEVQRYHIDVFCDLEKIIAIKNNKQTMLYENGGYVSPPSKILEFLKKIFS